MVNSVRYRLIDLTGIASPGGAIQLSCAEVAEPPYNGPFAVVRYLENGKEQQDGLRLDLDKGVFLDHFENEDKESFLKSVVSQIIDIINASNGEQSLDELGRLMPHPLFFRIPFVQQKTVQQILSEKYRNDMIDGLTRRLLDSQRAARREEINYCTRLLKKLQIERVQSTEDAIQ